MKEYTKRQHDLDIKILKKVWQMLFPCIIGLGLMGFLWLSHSLAVFIPDKTNGWDVAYSITRIAIGVIGLFFVGACIGSFIILFTDEPER